jgi:glycosyltransferase involved in cell wall biosynthesis
MRAETHPQLAALLSSIAGEDNVDPELSKRIRAVTDLLLADDISERPFLTVLLRTQGRRLEALKDALLCLAAQTNRDFEVIVLLHGVEESAATAVHRIIDRQPAEFAARIRALDVTGGMRSKPLNAGIAAARGRYVAVFDDDDLVFGHWVEEFASAAQLAQGRLIRAVVAVQDAAPETWPQGRSGFRTSSWPSAEYPSEFNQLDHLLVNFSPFMSWAFPRSLFELFGLRFDEELTVCEDWDMILRGSTLCGVQEIQEMTAIYRRWTGAETSYSSHSRDSWRESEQRVLDRLDSRVVMLPPGSVGRIRALVDLDLKVTDFRQNYSFLYSGDSFIRPVRGGLGLLLRAARNAVRVRNRVRRGRRA